MKNYGELTVTNRCTKSIPGDIWNRPLTTVGKELVFTDNTERSVKTFVSSVVKVWFKTECIAHNYKNMLLVSEGFMQLR